MLRAPHGRAAKKGLPGSRVEVAPTTGEALSQPRGKRPGTLPAIIQSARIVAHEDAAPFMADGLAWRDAVLADYTQRFQRVGPAEASVIESAAIELAASRFLFALAMKRATLAAPVKVEGSAPIDPADGVAELFVKASRLAGASRQNNMAAWEMLVRSTEDDDEPGEVDATEAARKAEERAAARRLNG